MQRQREIKPSVVFERVRMAAASRVATCPTCKQSGKFEYLGEQQWPIEIAAQFGLPPVMGLWSCPVCHTTISEPDLLPPHASVPNKAGYSSSEER